MIDAKDWKWFGRAGHFICGEWCRFHLCTQVGKFLISTVGEYEHPRHSDGKETTEEAWRADNWPGEEIGAGRKYETMVFLAGEPCSREDCLCGLPEIDGDELDFCGSNRALEATENHYRLCQEWSDEAEGSIPLK